MTGTAVTALDPRSLADRARPTGASWRYDRLLLTTGAEPRRLPIPGADLDGVHYLRTLADCDALRERLDQGGRVVVDRRRLDRSRVRRLGAPARRRGDGHRPGVGAARARARPGGRRDLPRRAPRARRASCCWAPASRRFEGERLRASGARPATGARSSATSSSWGSASSPRVELAEAAGLTTDNGIVVDESLADQRPRRVRRRRRRERLAPVLRPTRPRRALGQRAQPGARGGTRDARPGRQPTTGSRTSSQTSTTSAWSTQALRTEWDEVVFRGDPASREFIAFWLRERARRRGHERQRLGRQRARPGADPLAPGRRRSRPRRPRHPAGLACWRRTDAQS